MIRRPAVKAVQKGYAGDDTPRPASPVNMLTYFFLLIFLWWLLLPLTFVPALAVGLVCAWRMDGVSWRKGLLAGIAGGFVGVAGSMGWYWLEGLFLLPGASSSFVGYFLLPIPSGSAAWGTCRVWRSRSLVNPT